MADRTGIEWCDSTFNPWIGCTKVSPACDNCYAERQDARGIFGGTHWGPGVPRKRTSAANWRKPLSWSSQPFCECPACGWRGERREATTVVGLLNIAEDWCPSCSKAVVVDARRRVFCASLADVFDNEIGREWRDDLATLILDTPGLDWLLLTKRIGNAGTMLGEMFLDGPPENLWLGATICNQSEAERDIPKLLATPAYIRFLSIEPMLGRVDLTPAYLPCPNAGNIIMDPETGGYECCSSCDYTGIGDEIGIDWVIVGGESGPHARPMHPNWVRSLRDECAAADVPFMFKQWGAWAPGEIAGPNKNPIMAATWWNGGWEIQRVGPAQPDDHIDDEPDLFRIGKKAAGRLLDGVEHNGFPGANR